jgi:hypothetical protein
VEVARRWDEILMDLVRRRMNSGLAEIYLRFPLQMSHFGAPAPAALPARGDACGLVNLMPRPASAVEVSGGWPEGGGGFRRSRGQAHPCARAQSSLHDWSEYTLYWAEACASTLTHARHAPHRPGRPIYKYHLRDTN